MKSAMKAKDKEVKNIKNFFVNVWRKNIFDIYVTEYLICRDGIYFNKILVSEYKLFKRSNKANLLIALVQ
jgi:hypothetical protein